MVSFAVDLVVVAVAADAEPLLGLCLYSLTHTKYNVVVSPLDFIT